MRYEDRISVDTPEGVALEMTLAGVGSRFTAAIVDTFIQFCLIIALFIVASVGGGTGPLIFIGTFLVFFGYDVLFETLASGRTPGKRLAGLRVVRVGGGPITFFTSATRNILRLIDLLPGSYIVGIIAILASSRNQRLGDLAAGTIVVRERLGGRRPPPVSAANLSPIDPVLVDSWDVSSVTANELAAVRSFLGRRSGLTTEARGRLAWELAARLRPRVVGPDDDIHPEVFLERLSAAKAARP